MPNNNLTSSNESGQPSPEPIRRRTTFKDRAATFFKAGTLRHQATEPSRTEQKPLIPVLIPTYLLGRDDLWTFLDRLFPNIQLKQEDIMSKHDKYVVELPRNLTDEELVRINGLTGKPDERPREQATQDDE